MIIFCHYRLFLVGRPFYFSPSMNLKDSCKLLSRFLCKINNSLSPFVVTKCKNEKRAAFSAALLRCERKGNTKMVIRQYQAILEVGPSYTLKIVEKHQRECKPLINHVDS